MLRKEINDVGNFLARKIFRMICEPGTEDLSLTNLGAASAHLVGTYWFCVLTAQKGFNVELWGIYFVVVVGHQQLDSGLLGRIKSSLPKKAPPAAPTSQTE